MSGMRLQHVISYLRYRRENHVTIIKSGVHLSIDILMGILNRLLRFMGGSCKVSECRQSQTAAISIRCRVGGTKSIKSAPGRSRQVNMSSSPTQEKIISTPSCKIWQKIFPNCCTRISIVQRGCRKENTNTKSCSIP